MRIASSSLMAAVLAAGCASTPPAEPFSVTDVDAGSELVQRIQFEQEQPREDVYRVLNALERLLPAWLDAKGRGRAAPIERELTRRVVVSVDDILAVLDQGPHERRLVAAWALGFARVPENDLGLESPHVRARDALVPLLDGSPDDLLRNALLGLWMLADADTPVRPLADIVEHHHDAFVRSNACLAMAAVLTDETAPLALGALLVALDDTEERVRLHAAEVARHFPAPALTARLQSAVRAEQTPLVLAAMVAALGAARDRSSAPLFVHLLESPRDAVALAAHRALVELFGVDRGNRRDDWAALVEQS